MERETSGEVESRKEAEENKENMRQSNCFTDASGIIYDIDSWNESVISGKKLTRKIQYINIGEDTLIMKLHEVFVYFYFMFCFD